MDIFIIVVLISVGLLLILAEIFLLPGVTFAIVGGSLFSIGGIVYAYSRLGLTGGNITLGCTVLVFGMLFLWIVKSKALDNIALKTDIESTIADEKALDAIKEGDTGVAVSRLNPIGKVRVDNLTVEAKSLGDFIDEGTEVVVLKVYPTQIVVQVKSRYD